MKNPKKLTPFYVYKMLWDWERWIKMKTLMMIDADDYMFVSLPDCVYFYNQCGVAAIRDIDTTGIVYHTYAPWEQFINYLLLLRLRYKTKNLTLHQNIAQAKNYACVDSKQIKN